LYIKTRKKITLSPSSTSSSVITQDSDDTSKSFTEQFDRSFFSNQTLSPKIKGKYAGEFNRVKLYPIHGKLGDDGKPIDGGRSTLTGVIAQSGKKHHKKGKKNVKNHGANGYYI